jgi:hypothetical protein
MLFDSQQFRQKIVTARRNSKRISQGGIENKAKDSCVLESPPIFYQYVALYMCELVEDEVSWGGVGMEMYVLWRDVNTLRVRLLLCYCVFQARQAKASIYICTTHVGNNRSRDSRGGKHSRNRWCATTGTPQALREQAQRLSRFSGRAARSGRRDAEEVDVVVGGAVGGRLKVT